MKHLIVSRTDAIGDVILTLPLCGILKQHFPELKISFLGKAYTQPIIEACQHIDNFLDVANLATLNTDADTILHVYPRKEILRWAYHQKIKHRICTSSRWYAWLYANKRVRLHRKNSELHESQLNIKLLEPLGLPTAYTLAEIAPYYGLQAKTPISVEIQQLFDTHTQNWIIHPTSQGSAREWDLTHYKQLIETLTTHSCQIFISGTTADKAKLDPWIQTLPSSVHSLVGKLTLSEFISVINLSTGLLAASTGPLHIAAALGKKAIGLYPPMRPIHPGRWQPVGTQATYLSLEKSCFDCKKAPQSCACIQSITPQQVLQKMLY